MNRHMYFRQQEKNYLAHHGIKGQKWGIRRYQNEDGSLTAEGRERYGNKKVSNKYDGYKVDYEDENAKVYSKTLNNGTGVSIQKYLHAIPGTTYKGEKISDKDFDKLQDEIVNEFEKNVFSKVDKLEKEWRKDPKVKAALQDIELDYGKGIYEEFMKSKPWMDYNIYQYTNSMEVNWSINDDVRLNFLVGKNGKINSSVSAT